MNFPLAAELVSFRIVHQLRLSNYNHRGFYVSVSGSVWGFTITTGVADVDESTTTITRSRVRGYEFKRYLTAEETHLVEEAFEMLMYLDTSRLGNVQCFFAQLEQKHRRLIGEKGPLTLSDVVPMYCQEETQAVENFVQDMIAHNWEREAFQLFCAIDVKNLPLKVYEPLFRVILEKGVRQEEFWREIFWQNLAERLGTILDIKERPTDWCAVLREVPKARAQAEQMLCLLDSDDLKAAVQLQSIVLHLNWFAVLYDSPGAKTLRALYSDPCKAEYLRKDEPTVYTSWKDFVPKVALEESAEDTSIQGGPDTPDRGRSADESQAAGAQSSAGLEKARTDGESNSASEEEEGSGTGSRLSVNAKERELNQSPVIEAGEGLEPSSKRACPGCETTESLNNGVAPSATAPAALEEQALQGSNVDELEEEAIEKHIPQPAKNPNGIEMREGLEPLPERVSSDSASSGSEATAAATERSVGEVTAAALALQKAAQAEPVDVLEEAEEDDPADGSDQEPVNKRVRRKQAKKGGGRGRKQKKKALPKAARAVVAVPKEKDLFDKLKRGKCVSFDAKFGMIIAADAERQVCQLYVYNEKLESVTREEVACKSLEKVIMTKVEDPKVHSFEKMWKPKPFKPYDWVVHLQDEEKIFCILKDDLGDHKFVACNVSKNSSGEIMYWIEEIDSMSFAKCNNPNLLKDLEYFCVGAFVLRDGSSLVWKIESLYDWTEGNQLRCIICSGDTSEDVLLARLKFLDLSTIEQAIATLAGEHIETRRSFLRDWKNAKDNVKRIRDGIGTEMRGAEGVVISDLESTIDQVKKEFGESGTFKALDAFEEQGDRIRNAMSYMRAHLFSLQCSGWSDFSTRWPRKGRLKNPDNAWKARFFGEAIFKEPKLGYITKTLFGELEEFIEVFVGLGFKFLSNDTWELARPLDAQMIAESDIEVEGRSLDDEMVAGSDIELEDFL